MTVVSFISLDVDAVEAGRRACHAIGDTDAAAQLSWLATRMRNAEIEQECEDIVLGRISAYGRGLRSVS